MDIDKRSSKWAQIRKAQVGDEIKLAALARQTFVDKFGHLYDPSDLNTYLDNAYRPDLQLAEIQADANLLLVAENDNGDLVGYGFAGPCKLPIAEQSTETAEEATLTKGEIKRLYFLTSYQGLGLGGQMVKQLIEFLETRFERLYLGVWSENFGAQRFYERLGFEKIGEYDFPVGKHLDREFILKRMTH